MDNESLKTLVTALHQKGHTWFAGAIIALGVVVFSVARLLVPH